MVSLICLFYDGFACYSLRTMFGVFLAVFWWLLVVLCLLTVDLHFSMAVFRLCMTWWPESVGMITWARRP